MKRLNSISGGRTSAYMAVHFPADLNVFAAVCMDNPHSAIKDTGLLKAVRSKLERFNEEFGEFIGSPEDPKTFKVVLDLEQMIGREISWVRGESFDKLTKRKNSLPCIDWRFCTTIMKMIPIAKFVYQATGGEKVLNCAGIRIDEPSRIKTEGHRTQVVDIPISKSAKGRNKWIKYEFAEATYPLVYAADGSIAPIRKNVIYDWAAQSGLDFPVSSNCQFCFHKGVSELIENQQRNPGIFQAGEDMEAEHGRGTMKKDLPLANIKKMQRPAFQLSFWGDESCESGFCTD